jgi:hypothetical protein
MRNISQGNWPLERDLNSVHTEYEAEMLATAPRRTGARNLVHLMFITGFCLTLPPAVWQTERTVLHFILSEL